MTESGEIVENYEDSEISKKDRSIDSFIEWVKLKSGENNITTSETKNVIHIRSPSKKSNRHFKPNLHFSPNHTRKSHTRKNKNKQRGGKWSLKYKRSINCRRPKGFSQRQHCKYGRK
jgi:hypothetical protein